MGASGGDDFASRLSACLGEVSQAELARKVGVSRTAVQDWKTGKHEPNQRHLRAIARTLRVSLEELLGPGTPPSQNRTGAETEPGGLDFAGALADLRRAQPEIERLASTLPSLMDLLDEAERRAD